MNYKGMCQIYYQSGCSHRFVCNFLLINLLFNLLGVILNFLLHLHSFQELLSYHRKLWNRYNVNYSNNSIKLTSFNNELQGNMSNILPERLLTRHRIVIFYYSNKSFIYIL